MSSYSDPLRPPSNWGVLTRCLLVDGGGLPLHVDVRSGAPAPIVVSVLGGQQTLVPIDSFLSLWIGPDVKSYSPFLSIRVTWTVDARRLSYEIKRDFEPVAGKAFYLAGPDLLLFTHRPTFEDGLVLADFVAGYWSLR